MKRQIKFRAWIEKDNVMISHREVIERAHLQFEGELNHNDIVMQFTGLQDIKGRDVYEGDIVNIYGGFGYFKNGEGVNVTYIVNFKTCEYLLFRPDIKLTWGRLSRLEEMNYKCEIIGNIYENPELLKTTENE